MQRIAVLADVYLRRVRELAELSPAESGFLAGAWVLARPITFVLATVGFPRVLTWLERTPGRAGRGRVGVARGEELVRWAFRAAACDTRDSCLPRAVVQYLLHHTFGPEPRLVVGVSRVAAPTQEAAALDWTLGAHAWIEVRGGPAREPSFTPILTLTPSEGVVRTPTA